MNRRITRTARAAALVLGAGLVLAGPALAQTPVGAVSLDPEETITINGMEVLHVRGNVYLIAGGSAHVVMQVGDQGVLLVDTGDSGESERILAAVRAVTHRPVRYIVNSSGEPAHVLGNGPIVETYGGARGPRPQQVGGRVGNQNSGVIVISHEGAYNRMSATGAGSAGLSGDALPASTFFTAKKDIYSNDEAVQIIHVPSAYTEGDVLVFFRGSDVIAAGEIFNTTGYPLIDREHGGSINGVIDGLNMLIDLAVPERNQMGGTRIVPSHGRIGNESDVVEYRDMLTIIRDRVQEMKAKGMSLQQVQASGVSLEYDVLYGSTTGPWTTAMFLEAVYAGVGGQ
ncbi:MAG: hypothetical protein AB7G23_01415 [Vicinamibacterales bacterium]